MKKILLFVFTMTALLWYGEWTSPSLTFATVVNPNTDCVMSGIGNAFISNTVPTPTPIAGCRFSARIDGLDGGTGITNTTKLTVPANKTLTIIDEGSNFSTLAVGSMVIEKGGSVVIPQSIDPETGAKTGSQIMIGAALYLKDEDGDGYPASGEQMAAYAQPSPTPGHWKRKNTFNTLTVDCVDTDATIPAENPCPGNVDFNTGDFERGKNIDSASLLQGYYGEIGKDPSLVGLWHMNETADNSCTGEVNDACDSSGNANDGAATGTTIVNGLMGKARSFNGTSDFISIPAGQNYNFKAGDFSISFWWKENGSTNGSAILSYGSTGLAYDSFLIHYTAGALTLYSSSTGSAWDIVGAMPMGTTDVGSYNHYVVTRSGSNFTAYKNGNVVGTATSALATVNGATFYVGKRVTVNNYIKGTLDELSIWRRALTPEEIKAQGSRSPWARYTSSVIDMGSAKSSVPLVWTGLGVGTRTWSTGTLDTTNEGETVKDSTGLVAQWNFNETAAGIAYNGEIPGVTPTATPTPTPLPSGGTITTSGGYRIHTFTSSGTYTQGGDSGNVQVLVVAGGGGGGSDGGRGGGGGAGGIQYSASYAVTSGQAITVTRGAGGAGGTNDINSANGGNSVFGTLTAIGGGRGGGCGAGGSDAGGNGGSGGGGAAYHPQPGGTGSQGYNGGTGVTLYYGAGGGGGNSQAGANGSGNNGGKGGDGTAYTISGSSVTYAGGGGGGFTGSGGAGGAGGGGAGSTGFGTAGTANTGGGGGGGGGGGTGGSGIVIVRYPYVAPTATPTPTPVPQGSCGAACDGTLTNFASTASQDQAAGTGWTLANKKWGAGALMFDGTDDYVNITNSVTTIKDFSTGSVEFWMNSTTAAGQVFAVGDVNASSYYTLGYYSGYIGVRYMSAGVDKLAAYSTKINLNEWNHVVFTVNASGNNLYINGSSQTLTYTAGTATTALFYSDNSANWDNVEIGRRNSHSAPGGWFNGTIDSVRIYSRALTPSEILSNYNAGNIEFQWRAGSTATPDSTDYAGSDTNETPPLAWTRWQPVGTAGYESQIDSMDTADKTWNVDNGLSDSSLTKKPTTAVSTGTGADGACSVTGTMTNINTQSCAGRGTADGVNFSSTVLTSAGATSIVLSTTPTGLTDGDEVLIINQQGTTSNNTSVGLYETHVIASISTNTLNFTDYALKNTYDGTTQKITVQRVPNYTNVTVGRAASGKSGADANNAGYSCLDLLNSGASADGAYWIDPDGVGGNAPVQAQCNMTRDGGGWTMAVKPWYTGGVMGHTEALGAIADATTKKGNAYKLADTTVRDIIGPSQNFDVMGDQNGWNSAYSTGNFEYVVLRNYTGYWRFDIAMADSLSETLFQSYRLSDNALATTFNLKCGLGGGAGINCLDVLSNNPQAGAGCNISMGSSTNVGWHHFFMSNYNTDTYLYVCNGAQHSSSYDLNHRFWVREKSSATLTASPWDGTSGGILAFRANGTVTVNNGAISTAGLGYRGGSGNGALYNTVRAYNGESFAGSSARSVGTTNVVSLDGGGGGGMLATGGPGGSHGSLGTNGVAAGGAGHEPYKGFVGITSGESSLTNRMLFGSGGGGAGDGYSGTAWGQANEVNGRGGSGGGITFIAADTLTVGSSGKIDSNGDSGTSGWQGSAANWISGGAGGGGAGGSIALVGNTLTLNGKLVTAKGGNTVSPYPGLHASYTIRPIGGLGGAGRIASLYSTATSGASEPSASRSKPQAKNMIEGTGSLQLTTDSLQSDGTVGLWHFGQNSSTKAFGYTGADQTYTVPAGVTSLTIKMWGGGGGGGAPGGWTYGYPGGGGGYTTGTLAVTPGQTLTVMVGAGGNKGSSSVKTTAYGGGGQNCAAAGTDCQYAGQGGGRSAVRISNVDYLTAGGGGGGGSKTASVSDMSGGGGGGSTGQAGWAADSPTAFGSGGTQSAGGAGATGTYTGSAGTQYLGGSPNTHSYGGGGGGGWYGGGGGGYASPSMGGAGGGSGYIAGTGVSSATTTQASARLQANMSDADNGGAGAGGLANTNGSPGKVIIIPNVSNTDLPYQEADSSGNNNHGTLTGTTLVDGVFGKARSFNGSSDYIDMGNIDSPVEGTTNWTVEWWENRDNYTGGQNVIGTRSSTNYGPGWNIVSDSTTYYFIGDDDSAASWDILCSNAHGSPTNQWIHYAITRSDNTFQWYKNGAAWGSACSDADVPSGGRNLTVGAGINTSGSPVQGFFNGRIDEVKISNVTRSADQIAEAYRLGRDKRVTKTISPTENLTNKSKLFFQFAGDRLGTYSEMTVGNSAFANYEPDANTVGLWHLEEKAGTGAYMKDSSGNGYHGTPAMTYTDGKIGKGRLGTAATEISLGSQSIADGLANVTVSAWVYPTAQTAATHFRVFNEQFVLYVGQYGAQVSFYMGNGTAFTNNSVVGGALPINQWSHVVWVKNGTAASVYINGAKSLDMAAPATLGTSANINYIGSYDGATQGWVGTLDEVRVDNVARTPDKIREAYEVGKRTHPITVDFRSGLVTNLITDVTDKSFSVDETVYGSTAKANHLFVGDKIIVKENVGGTEYIAQGTVATVDSSTGSVSVSAWDSGSTFPTGGFTVNATVFKWQREIMDLTGSLPLQRSAITYLTFRPTDMSSGATMWIDDIRSGGPYINTSPTTLTPSSASRYFQLRALFSTTDTATSSSLTSLRIQDIPTPLTPTPTPSCQIGCYKCSEGSAVPVTAGEDDNEFCQPAECSGKTWGWLTASCMEAEVKTANNGFCNGAGSCYSVFSDICQISSTVQASCGSEGCKKACVQNTSSTSYNTVGEICYTDYAQHACPTGEKCSNTGTCVTCNPDGTACTVNSDCCTGTCTTFYTDSDGDGYGTGSAVKKCGTTVSGYATNNTDCNDTGTSSANVWISATCYVDVDNDNYGSTTAKSCTNHATCGSATWASGGAGTAAASGNFAAGSTDCCDTDVSAYPGSTVCKTTARTTCGGYDYNCSGGNTFCGTAYYPVYCVCQNVGALCIAGWGSACIEYAVSSQVCGGAGYIVISYACYNYRNLESPTLCMLRNCAVCGYKLSTSGTQGCQ